MGDTERRKVFAQLFGDTGLFVVDNDEPHFASAAIEGYLAACHNVRRKPGGPSFWRPLARKRLVLKKTRPGAEVNLYLVALWWQHATPLVDRWLRRLLDERNRYAGIPFAVELCLRDLLPDSDIRAWTADALGHALNDNQLDHDPWLTEVDQLYRLDPATAIAALENLVRSPTSTTTCRRRLAAVDELTKYEPARGAKTLGFLAENLRGEPDDRYETADLIGVRDHEWGVRAMRLLVHSPDMGELRVAAAKYTGSALEMLELVKPQRNVSDGGRLELFTEVLGLDRKSALAIAEPFARTATDQDTPLRIAALVRPYDPQMVLHIAEAVAWPAGVNADSFVRRRAVDLIGEIDSSQMVPSLHRLSGEQSVTDQVRLGAAKAVLSHSGSIVSLVDVGKDPTVNWTIRTEIAKLVAPIDPVTGAQLYILIAKSGPPTDRAKLTLLKEAHDLDSTPAAEAIVQFVKAARSPNQVHLEAVEMVRHTLTKQRVLDLFEGIGNTADGKVALSAGRRAKVFDPVTGQRQLARLADRTNLDDELRLAAANEAGRAGLGALRKLARTARSKGIQLKAAQALYALDAVGGASELQRLVSQGRGVLRIDAALSLTGKMVVDALVKIAEDRREGEAVRLDAGLKAKERDPRRGRKALRTLVNDSRVSPATRNTAKEHCEE
jgi:hypothetical protein